MSEVSQQSQKQSRVARGSKARTVVYFDVQPRQTLSWRVARDAELRVDEASVWLTREGDPYDYWLLPGDVACLARGERVWVSSDAQGPLEVSLTTYRRTGMTQFGRWLARLWPRVARGSNASAF
jgi:quercetin dioxygenase-like cupin family protein